ncbi:MAG: tRNA (adenosine(37)-N6)-threonylcarbamoyltransferase complex dimerization subunit type 1 TsaB, partial [Glaciimonas sp.]|nr:tRNA (adenosine(37)-N6)-threonylcarbamoyltransferase complex dimerization subunit type 1 TsaB [Glaciimonas sp.]
QGLAFGIDLPVLPIVTLAAMAHACYEAYGAKEVLSVLDARMGEVYWAQYRYVIDTWQVIVEPTLTSPTLVMPLSSVLACGNGLSAYSELFGGAAFTIDAKPVLMPHAHQIAQLGLRAFQQGLGMPATEAKPLYLRNKVAFTKAERAAKVTT